jgi:hypothetical protein
VVGDSSMGTSPIIVFPTGRAELRLKLTFYVDSNQLGSKF